MENDNNMNGNLNDNLVLNALVLTRGQWGSGIVEAIIFTLIAVTIFFAPVTVRGSMDVTFGIIYKNIKTGLGLARLWMRRTTIMGNGPTSVYGEYFCKNRGSAVYRYYQEDSVLYPLFYLLGSIFALILMLHYIFPFFEGPAVIVSPGIGEIVCSIAADVAWIISVSAALMPFLLNYGTVDFIGSLMEPPMRPVFKISGRSAISAIASFIGSASVGVLITSELYQKGIYTKKEVALIATGFSAVSVGFAYKVIETADLPEYFLPIYFTALLVTLIVSFFMAKIPPLPRKASIFTDGRRQTKEGILMECVSARVVLKTGASRAAKRAATTPNLLKETRSSLLDNCYVLPKVISLLTAVGIIAMFIVTYIPVFNWIGKLSKFLLALLQVPNATEIVPSLPVEIAETFLSVLMTAGKVGTLAMGARYMIVTVSMVQIIFFSEIIVVMMPTKVPVSLKKLIVCFSEWTIVAIPISALLIRLLF